MPPLQLHVVAFIRVLSPKQPVTKWEHTSHPLEAREGLELAQPWNLSYAAPNPCRKCQELGIGKRRDLLINSTLKQHFSTNQGWFPWTKWFSELFFSRFGFHRKKKPRSVQGDTNVHECKHRGENTHRVYDPLQGFKPIVHWEDVIFAVSNPGQLTQWGEEMK